MHFILSCSGKIIDNPKVVMYADIKQGSGLKKKPMTTIVSLLMYGTYISCIIITGVQCSHHLLIEGSSILSVYPSLNATDRHRSRQTDLRWLPTDTENIWPAFFWRFKFLILPPHISYDNPLTSKNS